MKKHLSILTALFCTACTLQQPVQNTDIPDATGGPVPTRVGVASSVTWLWLWESGDSSVATAQKNGGITQVSSITKSKKSYLGIVEQHTTTVRGD